MATRSDDPGPDPSFATRVGMALAAPRWALALADDPRHPGRAGSDLLRVFALLLLCVHTRAVVVAVWLGTVGGLGTAGQALLSVMSQALTAPLAFLAVGTAGVYVGGGPRRSVGRGFDLACVALVPLLAVELVVTLVVRAAGLPLPAAVRVVVRGAGFAWSGVLLALALVQLRRRRVALGPVPAEPGGRS